MTAIVVDTHIALWALGDPARLDDRERALLTDPAVRRWLSPMSVWEAAIKRDAGRLRAPTNLAAVLASQFDMLTVDAALLEKAAALPRHHGDPFDRTIIAHGLQDQLPILTRDRIFADYGVALA